MGQFNHWAYASLLLHGGSSPPLPPPPPPHTLFLFSPLLHPFQHLITNKIICFVSETLYDHTRAFTVLMSHLSL
ncbi:hypothetical protein GDO78_007948 [Eleutherodactylus coqui]|uniref:Uncharacterized protein n=1 Tax=Eleutherodactylus coqui TaxID=57060 RepID=A0A8J6FIX3_ELECQ|nr:hypothetical protein GDO78_007948 [Eleutherodactylus coqui]